MRPRYLSPELFHFVGSKSPLEHERNYSVLKTILSSGCVSHPPHETGWGKVSYALDLDKRLAREELLVPTVTCYCDIPFEDLRPHIQKFGSFGLSFSRHHLTKYGARPVIYIPCRPDDWASAVGGHRLLDEIESTFRAVFEQSRLHDTSGESDTRQVKIASTPTTLHETLVKAEHTLALSVLAFIKPYQSAQDEADPTYYYSEREWRKLGNFVFDSSDVLRVVVHSAFIERAREELPEYRDRLATAP